MTRIKNKNSLIRGAAVSALLSAGLVLSSQAVAQAPRLMTPTAGIENQLSFADLVEQVSPAVVSVNTEQSIEVERPAIPREFEEFFGRRFGDQFNDQFRDRLEQRAQAQGSGFFIDGNGHIVTNHHVIDAADKITVRLTDGTELEATLIGSDPGTDLAVLKVDADRNQAYVEFAQNLNLRVGEWVLAVGNPFGLGGTVTTGIISAIDRESFTGYSNYLQIDAPINRGNSGGPAFDLTGRVIGVNTAILSPTGGSVGIGFAIPADTASYVVSQLIEKGSVTRGWLGVEIRPFDNNHAAAVGLASSDGALVVNVQEETPAKKAGMRSGDIVLKFDGKDIEDARGLTRAVGGVEPGKTVDLLVFRDGKNKTLKVKLGERNEEALAENAGSAPAPENSESVDELAEELGVRFESLDDEIREELGLDETVKGVVVAAVLPGSAGAEAMLAPGMVVIEADNKSVTSPDELKDKISSAIKDGKEALLLRVQQRQQKDFRALPLDGLEDLN